MKKFSHLLAAGPLKGILAGALTAALLLLASCTPDKPGKPGTPEEPAYDGPPAGAFSKVIGEPLIIGRSEMVDLLAGYALSATGGSADASTLSLIKIAINSLIKHGVVIADIEYYTTGVNGIPTIASGTVAVPDDALPETIDRLCCITHGTCDIDAAPSGDDFPIEMVPVFHQTKTQLVVMPDYLGYGSSRTSDLQHPYLHTALTGKTAADMIQAVESWIAETPKALFPDAVEDYNEGEGTSVVAASQTKASQTKASQTKAEADSEGSDDFALDELPIQLCGYSQGGHGAIAALFELQSRGLTDRIERVDAGAGPQDLEAFFQTVLSLQGRQFSNMGFIAYFIRGLIYGDRLDVDPHSIFAPEVFAEGFQDKIPYEQFSRTMLSSWHSMLGKDITKVLHSDFFGDMASASKDVKTMMASMASNSAINYSSPQNPRIVTFYHGASDPLVPYACSVNAHNKWPASKLVDLEAAPDNHNLGGLEFYIRMLDDNGQLWTSLYSIIQNYL